MTRQQLTARLTANLKTYIQRLGHIDSGDLLKSARVVSSGEFDFKVVGPDYIQYLDDGEFINNFFALPSTIELLEQYMAITITFTLTQKQ